MIPGSSVIRSRQLQHQRVPRCNECHSQHPPRLVKPWQKLLWTRQPGYHDNYTDSTTFLDHLQRNPRFRPYQFWVLMDDLTVIVQHVCSVIVFVCAFAAIFQDRVGAHSVAGVGSVCTSLAWALYEYFYPATAPPPAEPKAGTAAAPRTDSSVPRQPRLASASLSQLNVNSSSVPAARPEGKTDGDTVRSNASVLSSSSSSSVSEIFTPSVAMNDVRPLAPPKPLQSASRRRIATLKSTVLLFCALLGLSPILASLTKSTTSDSIWAISTWLLLMNILFFDYSGISHAHAVMPASLSLSTNAALMASTVLASRLNDTRNVFLFILFSIEVFGIFPFFRRYLREASWPAHIALTTVLVVMSGSGLAFVLSSSASVWGNAILGGAVSLIGTAFIMGACSWWLIGLQQYKNEIHGPWDPARPIIQHRWDY